MATKGGSAVDNTARNRGCFFLQRLKVLLPTIGAVKLLCATKRTQQHVLKEVHANVAVLVEVNRTKTQQGV